MTKSLKIIFNDPIATELENELVDVILAWVEAHDLTVAVIPGLESETEEAGDVEENQ